jgi:hypothetical protein
VRSPRSAFPAAGHLLVDVDDHRAGGPGAAHLPQLPPHLVGTLPDGVRFHAHHADFDEVRAAQRSACLFHRQVDGLRVGVAQPHRLRHPGQGPDQVQAERFVRGGVQARDQLRGGADAGLPHGGETVGAGVEA